MSARGLGDDGGKRYLRDISTRWSVLKGPPREALGYLYRVYGAAILGYIRGRFVRGDFSPMRAQDADDVLQEFFLRLGKTQWLDKPDPARGRFRPYLVRRLDFFLREQRSAALAKREPRESRAVQQTVPDPLIERLEREWRLATIDETLARIGKRNRMWAAALSADLAREDESDAVLARRLGRSVGSFRSLLKRARAAFRDLHPLVNERLDGFGGESF